jgi:hypothetical protein
MSNIIFKPGNWVYFVCNDRIYYGQILRKYTTEDKESIKVLYVIHKGPMRILSKENEEVREDGEIFQTKQEVLDFLMANVVNDAKS